MLEFQPTLKPIINKVFGFTEAKEAYQYLWVDDISCFWNSIPFRIQFLGSFNTNSTSFCLSFLFRWDAAHVGKVVIRVDWRTSRKFWPLKKFDLDSSFVEMGFWDPWISVTFSNEVVHLCKPMIWVSPFNLKKIWFVESLFHFFIPSSFLLGLHL